MRRFVELLAFLLLALALAVPLADRFGVRTPLWTQAAASFPGSATFALSSH